MKNKFLKSTNDIIQSEGYDEKKIITILQRLLYATIKTISEEINQKPIIEKRKITIGSIEEELGARYGIKRKINEIIIGDWIFNLRKTTQSNILIFLITKESLMHFFDSPINDVTETIINFVSILYLQKQFNIQNIENPLIVTINRVIYPETIAGRDFYYFNLILDILFRKRVDFSLVFNKLVDILKGNNVNESTITNLFSSWVYTTTIKDEEVIAPIVIGKKLIPVIDYLIEHGYDSKVSEIAQFLNKHENSIRYQIRQISSYYFAFWQPKINYEKLKLHNYFLKINLVNNNHLDQLKELLLNIPYNKSLYTGISDENNILYSPSFISPHFVAESLEEKLMRFERKNQIKDFTLQLIGERYHYTTITTSSRSKLLTEPTIETFKKLFDEHHSNLPLEKYIFSHSIRDISPVFDDSSILDYNLLYFLSFLQQKYLLGGRYGGWVHELPKFYEVNNLTSTNVEEVVNFLSQIETRVRRREILSFSLYIRPPTNRGQNVLIFETPLKNDRTDIIDKIRIFPRLFQFILHDRFVFIIPGISHKHPVKKMIQRIFEQEGVESIFYTINLAKSRFVPLHDFFDYEEQKWKL
ncbi:MAG: hypothetical protein FK730_00590 [Asgard group archaeon]|nr:hypothetical protein [Asgard group archaeon]